MLCPLKRHTHHGPDVTDCQAGVLSRSSCSGSLGSLLRGSPLRLRGSFLGAAQMHRNLLGYLGMHLDLHLVGGYADDECDGFTVHADGLVEPADLGEGSRMLIALHDPPAGRTVSGRRVGHFVHHLVPKAGDSCLKISVASSSGISLWRGTVVETVPQRTPLWRVSSYISNSTPARLAPCRIFLITAVRFTRIV